MIISKEYASTITKDSDRHFSTIGTGAYFGAQELMRAPTIKEQLTKENFRFINLDDSDQWTAEFESDIVRIQAAWGSGIKDGVTLKDKCKAVMASDSEKNKADIANVKKWCGIRTISSQLERKGKKFLVNSTEDNSALEGKWTATYNKRKQDQTKRTSLGLQGEWPTPEKNEIDAVKTLCRDKGNSDFLVSDDATYKAIENWCTEEGASVEFKP